jgi:hypothetical protein
MIPTLNNPDEKRYQPYRYAADQPQTIEPAATGRPNPQTFEYRTPCSDPKGHDESDLCAQWRSAKAAENSTLWTERGFWIAVVGSALLLWQIILTRQAVEDTSEATEAMRKANEIAEHAQRPWVKIDCAITNMEKTHNGIDITFRTIIKNVGNMVARNLWFETDCRIIRDDTENLKDSILGWFRYQSTRREIDEFSLIPGDEITSDLKKWQLLTHETWPKPKTKIFRAVLLATVHYRFEGSDEWKMTEVSFIAQQNLGEPFTDQLLSDDMEVRQYFTDEITARRSITGRTT